MLAELAEARATGATAGIYAEIRATTGVPYVSSLQRHLATRPGWLEWCWQIVGPSFRCGELTHRTLVAAEATPVPAFSDTRAASLSPNDRAAIHNVLDCFIRVSPTNLGFSSLVRGLLTGDIAPARPSRRATQCALPPPLRPPAAMLDIESAGAGTRAQIMRMAVEVDGEPFVPGLYRMLARWPDWFEATVDGLDASRAEAAAACADLSARIDGLRDTLAATLDTTPPSPATNQQDSERAVTAIDGYRQTSPQMVVYCRMIKQSLPPP